MKRRLCALALAAALCLTLCGCAEKDGYRFEFVKAAGCAGCRKSGGQHTFFAETESALSVYKNGSLRLKEHAELLDGYDASFFEERALAIYAGTCASDAACRVRDKRIEDGKLTVEIRSRGRTAADTVDCFYLLAVPKDRAVRFVGFVFS